MTPSRAPPRAGRRAAGSRVLRNSSSDRCMARVRVTPTSPHSSPSPTTDGTAPHFSGPSPTMPGRTTKIAAAWCPPGWSCAKIVCVVTNATTLPTAIGVNDRIEKSSRMTSSVNSTPPIGEPKIALMPAAVPHPISTGSWAFPTWNSWPTPELMAAPIWTIGPSAPADPPDPIVTALVRIFSTAVTGRMRPAAAEDGLDHVHHPVPLLAADDVPGEQPDDQPAGRREHDQQRQPVPVQHVAGNGADVQEVADEADRLVERDGRPGAEDPDHDGQRQQDGVLAEAGPSQQAGDSKPGTRGDLHV